VNIDALAAPETRGRGKIRMVVSDPGSAREALRAAKYRLTEEAALSVTLENRPGALAALAEKLAGARVNVKSMYATTSGAGTATVVLTVSNVDRARSAIG
jgi:hypothetical protein